MVLSTLVMTAVLAACGGGGLQPEDPALALRQGGAATATLKTVTATMKVTKGTISFQGFALVAATAAIRLPDESDTTYTVRQQDVQLRLQVVIVGTHVYLKPPLLRFSELTPQQGASIPNLAKLFDPTTGLATVIPSGRDPKYQAVDSVDGVESHRVSATYSAEQITRMLPQLSSQSDVSAVIWVSGSDHFIRKAVLSGKFGDKGADCTVEVDLSGFNGSVNITSPARSA